MPKREILCVSKTRFNSPALAVERDDFPGRERAVAGGQMPSLLHTLSLHAHHRADLLAGGGDFRLAQLARPPAQADPIGGQPRFAVGGADVNVATKADDVAKAKALQKLEQLDVAKASVGQDRDGDALGEQFLQTGQAGVLEVIALVLQFVLVDGEPDERRSPSVVGGQMQGKGGLVVGVKVGPIHRHDDLASFAHDLAHPCGEQVPGDDACIAEQPVDLFDPRLRQNSPRLRQRLTDQRDRQRRRRHDPERPIGQRENTLGV